MGTSLSAITGHFAATSSPVFLSALVLRYAFRSDQHYFSILSILYSVTNQHRSYQNTLLFVSMLLGTHRLPFHFPSNWYRRYERP